jgi:hypothetical protein
VAPAAHTAVENTGLPREGGRRLEGIQGDIVTQDMINIRQYVATRWKDRYIYIYTYAHNRKKNHRELYSRR